ncbi:hypothetical protein TNCV_4248231 [Trichonephila clavipes]|nr:hypothetical protein TNCV_4248231 [Trichonephila clavipes]
MIDQESEILASSFTHRFTPSDREDSYFIPRHSVSFDLQRGNNSSLNSPRGEATAYQLLHRSINRQVANWVTKVMPTWLYRQHFTMFRFNHHYNWHSSEKGCPPVIEGVCKVKPVEAQSHPVVVEGSLEKHETTPLMVRGDIEDVSSELDNRVKGCTSWMKRSELYCSRRVKI